MNCENINNGLFDYADGKLSAAENAEMEKHLSNCVHCQLLLTETRSFLTEIEQEKKTTSNPYLAEKIIAKLEEKENPVPVWKPVLRLAAVLIIGIATGILLNNFLQSAANDDSNDVTVNENAIDANDILGNDNNILTLNE